MIDGRPVVLLDEVLLRRTVAILALSADALSKDRRASRRSIGERCSEAAAELRAELGPAPLRKVEAVRG